MLAGRIGLPHLPRAASPPRCCLPACYEERRLPGKNRQHGWSGGRVGFARSPGRPTPGLGRLPFGCLLATFVPPQPRRGD